MKKALLLIIVLVITLPLHAQDEPENTGIEYGRKYAELYKAYVQEPENVANNYALALFYSDTLNPMLNYALAMRYISAAEEHYIAIVEDRSKYKEVSRLIKKKITVVLVRQTKRDIVVATRALLNSDTPLSNDMLDRLSTAFANDRNTLLMIESKRLHARYIQACETNTLDAYMAFIESYPSTTESENAEEAMSRLATTLISKATRESEVDSILGRYTKVISVQRVATKKKSAIAYANLVASPSPERYKDFLRKYPGSDHYMEIVGRLDNQIAEEFSRLTTARQFADFIAENPDNPLSEKAMEKIKQLITEERDRTALDIYLKEFPLDANYNDIYLDYFNWHNEEGNKSPLDIFAAENPDFPYRMALQDALTAAEEYDKYDINMPFAESDISEWSSKIFHLTGKKESFVALQRTLQTLIAAKEWDKIPERISSYSISFENYCLDEIAELRSIVSAPTNNRFEPKPVVYPAYDMIHPVMYPDKKHLYFNKQIGDRTVMLIAQYQVNKNNAVWRSIGEVKFSNIENDGLLIYSFFDNGKKMLLGKDGDIMVATFQDTAWEVDVPLPAPINSKYYDYDAYMLPDSSGILFASDRDGGMNLQKTRSYFHGDTALASDIYFCPLTDNGWGEAINLGINVNSPYMECSPLISTDLKTLYFITDGRGGLGYGDVYYVTRDNINDWRHWSKPKNYGKEVNSGFNEASISFAGDETALVVNTNYRGKYGCFSVNTVHPNNPIFNTVTVKSTSVGIVADIYNIANQTAVNSRQIVEREQEWSCSFYSNNQYLLLSECEGLFVPGISFKPSQNALLQPVAYEAATLLSMSEKDEILPLPAIIFEANHSNLLITTKEELNHLANFLRINPTLSVEFIIHVEGNDDVMCFHLSQERGQAIKNYLVLKGINTDRIAISAYGNSMTKQGKAVTSTSIMIHEQ